MQNKYHNRYLARPRALADAARWLWKSRREFLRPVRTDFVRAPNDPAFLKANRHADTLTWIGHASFLLQLGGINAVTDPHLTRRASPSAFVGPKRLAPLGLDFADLPPLDLALISHNHYDHLDDATVRRLAREHPQLQFIVPMGLKAWFARRGITRVTELDWWQAATVGNARITAVPVQHFSGRGVFDRNATQWCGLVLEAAGRRVFFAGDTGYSRDFADIGERFAPIDLALLPIGAYQPRDFMRAVHVDPEEAVQIFQDIGAQQAAAMHWGTFRLTLEPLGEPPQRLAAALDAAGIARDRFFAMQHGETRRLRWDQPPTTPGVE